MFISRMHASWSFAQGTHRRTIMSTFKSILMAASFNCPTSFWLKNGVKSSHVWLQRVVTGALWLINSLRAATWNQGTAVRVKHVNQDGKSFIRETNNASHANQWSYWCTKCNCCQARSQGLFLACSPWTLLPQFYQLRRCWRVYPNQPVPQAFLSKTRGRSWNLAP